MLGWAEAVAFFMAWVYHELAPHWRRPQLLVRKSSPHRCDRWGEYLVETCCCERVNPTKLISRLVLSGAGDDHQHQLAGFTLVKHVPHLLLVNIGAMPLNVQ